MTGDPIHLSKEVICKMLIMTMADTADQHYGWQDRLFLNDDGKLIYYANNFTSLWPGDEKPGLWMNLISRIGINAFNFEFLTIYRNSCSFLYR